MTLRRSVSVQLTILPMIASAAVASADELTDDPPPMEPIAGDPPVSPPGLTPPITDGVPPSDPGRELGPADMRFSPPGMTPTVDEIDCDDVPYWEYRLECQDVIIEDGDPGIVRGGFGTYFWTGGG